MEYGCEVGLGMSMEVRTELRLSHEMRVEIVACMEFEVAMDLVQDLRGGRYHPHAVCPHCGRSLNPHEILIGFNPDPHDFTTRCSGCGSRFRPLLVRSDEYISVELPFFCVAQTLDQLSECASLTPEELQLHRPAVYHAAVVHFGGLRRAFNQVGILYSHEEISGWEGKVKPFLGRLPDVRIAMIVDRPVRVIRLMRRALGVPRYTKAVMLRELNEVS